MMKKIIYIKAFTGLLLILIASSLQAQAPANIDVRVYPVGTLNQTATAGEIIEIAFKTNALLTTTADLVTLYLEAPTALFNGNEVFDVVEENLGVGVNLIFQSTFEIGATGYTAVSFVMAGSSMNLNILPLNQWRHAFTVTMTGATTLTAQDLVVADQNSQLYAEFFPLGLDIRTELMAVLPTGEQYNELLPIFNFPVLPLDLISFDARKLDDKSSLLEWATVNEVNSSHFIVQSSRDKLNWRDIGQVQGAGNSIEVKNYSFVDENVYNGIDSRLLVYYRLIMVDFDGALEVSPIKSIVFGNSDVTKGRSFKAYPNPATDGIHVEWNADILDQPTQIELFDTGGKVVYVHKVGENSHQEYLDFSKNNIHSGLYFIRFMSGDEPLEYKQIVIGQR